MFHFFFYLSLDYLFFFFQAEDGIRDGHVTGVQTCALPISNASSIYPTPTTAYLGNKVRKMRIGAIGVGQAGGRILDAFVYNNIWGGHKDVLPLTLAINAAKADLLGLSSVPKKDRILLGHTLVKGHGAGGNPEMWSKVAEDDKRNIR